MVQVNEQVNFDDKVVIVPVELARDRDVPGEALALYTVMKSFGPRAEAKVTTYGSRLGWHEDRVQKYQRILQAAGWIVLVREGANAVPRLWWMCRVKNEQPPQELVTRGGKTQGVQNTTPGKTQGVQKAGGAKHPPEAVEGSSSSRRTTKRESESQSNSGKSKDSLSLSASPKDLKGILARLSGAFKLRHQHELTPTAMNLQLAGQLETVFGSDLETTWERFLSDAGRRVPGQTEGWLDLNRHPMAILLSQPDSYRTTTSTSKPEDKAKSAKAKAEEAHQAERYKAKAEAERKVHAALSDLWPTLTKGQREHFLSAVASLSPFMHDQVRRHRQAHGLETMEPMSVLAISVLELWPEFPKLPPEAGHA